MEEYKQPSQVETIFWLFDGWLSKKTTQRLAERQKSCQHSMKGAYQGIRKKITRKSQRFFGRRVVDDQMGELEDRLARLAIDDGKGREMTADDWRLGPGCFRMGFSWRWRFVSPLPVVTEEQEYVRRAEVEHRPIHPQYGHFTSQWNKPISPAFGMHCSQWNTPIPPSPYSGMQVSPFGNAAATSTLLPLIQKSVTSFVAPCTPPPKHNCMATPTAPGRSTTEKATKKWSQSQGDCSHHTDRWWVQIDALNDCENCDEEWEFCMNVPSVVSRLVQCAKLGSSLPDY